VITSLPAPSLRTLAESPEPMLACSTAGAFVTTPCFRHARPPINRLTKSRYVPYPRVTDDPLHGYATGSCKKVAAAPRSPLLETSAHGPYDLPRRRKIPMLIPSPPPHLCRGARLNSLLAGFRAAEVIELDEVARRTTSRCLQCRFFRQSKDDVRVLINPVSVTMGAIGDHRETPIERHAFCATLSPGTRILPSFHINAISIAKDAVFIPRRSSASRRWKISNLAAPSVKLFLPIFKMNCPSPILWTSRVPAEGVLPQSCLCSHISENVTPMAGPTRSALPVWGRADDVFTKYLHRRGRGCYVATQPSRSLFHLCGPHRPAARQQPPHAGPADGVPRPRHDPDRRRRHSH